MERKPPDDLFQLVKSLSKSEKRYLRLFCSRYSGNKTYMELFDAIDAQNEYDECELRGRLGDDSETQRLAVAKNYLSKLILRALRAYYSQASLRIRLDEMIANVQLLYERGLFRQAGRQLRQAAKWVKRLDEPSLDLQILTYRQKLSGKGGRKMERLDDLHAERVEAMRRLEEQLEYNYLVEKLGNICTGSPNRGIEERARLNEIIAHPLFANKPAADATFNVRKLYLWGYATYHFGMSEYAKSLEYTRRLIRLYEEHEEILGTQQTVFLSLVDNLLILLAQCGMEDEYAAELCKLRERFGTTLVPEKLTQTRVMSSYLHIFFTRTLNLHCGTGEFERAIGLADEIELYLQEYPEFVGGWSRHCILLFLAYAFFALGQYDRAADYLNRIIGNREPIKSRSPYYSARLLEILLHYELGNFELVHSRIRSLNTRLVNAGLLGQPDKAALTALAGLVNASDSKLRHEILHGLIDTLDSRGVETHSHALLHQIDLVAWLRSKISGRPFAEEVRCWYREHHNPVANEPQ